VEASLWEAGTYPTNSPSPHWQAALQIGCLTVAILAAEAHRGQAGSAKRDVLESVALATAAARFALVEVRDQPAIRLRGCTGTRIFMQQRGHLRLPHLGYKANIAVLSGDSR
jgi:hypothetical protein